MAITKSFAKDDVLEICRQKLGPESFELIDWSLLSVESKMGLADHVLLNVQILVGGKTQNFSFFAKFYPSNEDQLMFVNATRAFDKEIFFYKKLNGNCRDCTPQYYFSKDKHVIVLENLMAAGFSTLDKRTVADYNTVSLVLKTLAKFHAFSLIYEENQSRKSGKSYRMNEEFSKELEERIYVDWENYVPTTEIKAAIKGILNVFDYFHLDKKLTSGQDLKDVLKEVCNTILTLAQPSEKHRNVISHGNLWASNVMIEYDQNDKAIDSRLIDFQAGRYTPPSQDVLSFLHLTTSRDFRKKHLKDLLNFYYNQLDSHVNNAGFDLKSLISYQDFLDSCNERKSFALVQAAIYFQFLILDTAALKELFGDSDYSQKAFYEDLSVVFYRNIDKDKFYKGRLKEAFEELRDFCET